MHCTAAVIVATAMQCMRALPLLDVKKSSALYAVTRLKYVMRFLHWAAKIEALVSPFLFVCMCGGGGGVGEKSCFFCCRFCSV